MAKGASGAATPGILPAYNAPTRRAPPIEGSARGQLHDAQFATPKGTIPNFLQTRAAPDTNPLNCRHRKNAPFPTRFTARGISLRLKAPHMANVKTPIPLNIHRDSDGTCSTPHTPMHAVSKPPNAAPNAKPAHTHAHRAPPSPISPPTTPPPSTRTLEMLPPPLASHVAGSLSEPSTHATQTHPRASPPTHIPPQTPPPPSIRTLEMRNTRLASPHAESQSPQSHT